MSFDRLHFLTLTQHDTTTLQRMKKNTLSTTFHRASMRSTQHNWDPPAWHNLPPSP